MNRRFFNSLLIFGTIMVLVLVGIRAMDEAAASGRTIGITVDEGDGDGRPIVVKVVSGLPADLAGIVAGDSIVAVGDVPVSSDTDLYAISLTLRRGIPVDFTLDREGVIVNLEVTPGTTFPWTQFGLDLLVGFGYLAVGLLARFRAADTLQARLLSAFSIAVALELALPIAIPGFAGWFVLREFLYYMLTGIQMGLELHLASVIPRKYEWFRKRTWLVYLYYGVGVCVGTIAAILTAAGLLGVPGFDNIGLVTQVIINDFLLVGWGLAVVAILLIQLRCSRTPGHRTQALLILLGVVPWAAFNIGHTVLSRMDIATPDWALLLQPLVLLVYPIAVFVAIVRYDLFDIDLVVRRSPVLALVTIGMGVLFLFALEAIALRFGEEVQAGKLQVAVFSFGMLILGLLFNPVRRWVQTTIDQRFFPEKTVQREHLAELAAKLPTLGSLTSMGQHLVKEVGSVFNVESATLMVADPRSGVLVSLATFAPNQQGRLDGSLLLESDDAGIRQLCKARRPIPADIMSSTSPAMAQRINAVGADLGVGLVNGETLVGLLLLGPKKDRQQFRPEELDLLRLFSHNLATVLENVRLFQSATYEQLTGLLRREGILDALEAEIRRAARYHRPLTVGMVDLDHFKRVNDTWGHLAGDALLQRVATALKEELRSTDCIGRYGGEEFLFFLPETSLEVGQLVAEKLRQVIEGLPSPLDDIPEIRVTTSIGLAELGHADDDHPPSARDLISAADAALLRAKGEGRNLVVTVKDPVSATHQSLSPAAG